MIYCPRKLNFCQFSRLPSRRSNHCIVARSHTAIQFNRLYSVLATRMALSFIVGSKNEYVAGAYFGLCAAVPEFCVPGTRIMIMREIRSSAGKQRPPWEVYCSRRDHGCNDFCIERCCIVLVTSEARKHWSCADIAICWLRWPNFAMFNVGSIPSAPYDFEEINRRILTIIINGMKVENCNVHADAWLFAHLFW